MNIPKYIRHILPLFLLTTILCACGTVDTPANTDNPGIDAEPAQGEFETFPLPAENVRTSDTLSPHAANHSGPGFYYAGQAISYAASITDKPVVLCSQSGCTHSDNSCNAYIGDARQFAEYQGQWYALVKDADSEYTLMGMDSITRERRTLGHWKAEENEHIQVSFHLLSHGYGYVTVIPE